MFVVNSRERYHQVRFTTIFRPLFLLSLHKLFFCSQKLEKYEFYRADSRSVLEKLEDSKGDERQYLAKYLGNMVTNTESLVLQWIPAHCRIEGNERADRLAKEGSVLEQIESDLTYREVKSIIKTSLNNKWKESHLEYNKQDGVYCLNRRGQTTILGSGLDITD